VVFLYSIVQTDYTKVNEAGDLLVYKKLQGGTRQLMYIGLHHIST